MSSGRKDTPVSDSGVVDSLPNGVNRRDVLQAFAAAGIISGTGAQPAAAVGETRGMYAVGDSDEFEDALVFQHKLNQQNREANPEDTTGHIDGERAGGAITRNGNLSFEVEKRRGLVLQFRGVLQGNKGGSYNVPLDRVPEPNGQAITWSVWIRPIGIEQRHTFVSRSLGFGLGVEDKRVRAYGWDGEEKTFTVGVRSDSSIVPNWWNHILATVEPGVGARLFVNGELRGETTDGEFTGFTEKFNEYLGVGWNSKGELRSERDGRFQGDMSDLRLYLGASADTEDATRVYDATHHGSAQHGEAHPEEWDVSVDMTPSELPIGGSEEVDVVVTYDSPRSLAGSRVYGANVYIDEDVGSYKGVTANNDPDADTNSYGEASIEVENVQEHTGIAVESEHGDVYSRSIPKTGDASDEREEKESDEEDGSNEENEEEESNEESSEEEESNEEKQEEESENEENTGGIEVSAAPKVVPEGKETTVTVTVSGDSSVGALPVTVNGEDTGETASTGSTDITITPDIRGSYEITVGSSDGVSGSASVYAVNVSIEEMKPVQTVWDAGPITDGGPDNATSLVEGKRTSVLSRISHAIGGADDDAPPADTEYSIEMSVETDDSGATASVSGVDGETTQEVTISGGEDGLRRVSSETTESNSEKRFFSQVASVNPPTGYIETDRTSIDSDEVVNGEMTFTVAAITDDGEKSVLAETSKGVELVTVPPIELQFYRMHDESYPREEGVVGSLAGTNHSPKEAFDSTVNYAVKFLKRVYPIPEDKIVVNSFFDKTIPGHDLNNELFGGMSQGSAILLDLIEFKSRQDGSKVDDERVFPVAICPKGYLKNHYGGSIGATFPLKDRYGNATMVAAYAYTTLAHEIAHVLSGLHMGNEEYDLITDEFDDNQTLNGYSPLDNEVVAENPTDAAPFHGQSFMNGGKSCHNKSIDGSDKLDINDGYPIWVSNTQNDFTGDKSDYDVLLETLHNDSGEDDIELQLSRDEFSANKSQKLTVSVTDTAGEKIEDVVVIFSGVKKSDTGTDERPVLDVTRENENDDRNDIVSLSTDSNGEKTVIINTGSKGTVTIYADANKTNPIDDKKSVQVLNENTETAGSEQQDSKSTSSTQTEEKPRENNQQDDEVNPTEFIGDITDKAQRVLTEIFS